VSKLVSKLERRLLRRVSQASREFAMLEPDDRVMVCVSGGKDSLAMLHLLRLTQKLVPFRFEVIAVHLDQNQPGQPKDLLPNFFEEQGVDYRIVERDTYSVVQAKTAPGKIPCSLCSRLRRGILYSTAEELGATKIALGHHRDDIIETALLNLLYSGQLKAMPPRLRSDDGKHVVIRPLAYCAEEDIAAYTFEQGWPIMPCGLCGSLGEDAQRQRVKALIDELHRDNPVVRGSMMAALRNVRVSHLLDRGLWDRLGHTEWVGLDETLAETDASCGVSAHAG